MKIEEIQPDINDEVDLTSVDKLAKGLVIGVAYSSNVGGIATLTGTGPNMILYEFGDE